MLCFLDFAGITGRSDVGDTAVDNEDCGNNSDHADDPLDEISDHGVRVDTLGCSGEIAITNIPITVHQCNTNRAHNHARGHSNREADEGLNESFLSVGDFAGVTAREDVLITAINNISDDKIGGNDGDISDNVCDDSPNICFQAVRAVDITNATVPRSETEHGTTGKIWSEIGGVSRHGDKSR